MSEVKLNTTTKWFWLFLWIKLLLALEDALFSQTKWLKNWSDFWDKLWFFQALFSLLCWELALLVPNYTKLKSLLRDKKIWKEKLPLWIRCWINMEWFSLLNAILLFSLFWLVKMTLLLELSREWRNKDFMWIFLGSLLFLKERVELDLWLLENTLTNRFLTWFSWWLRKWLENWLVIRLNRSDLLYDL